MRRIGGAYTGHIDAIGRDNIIIDGEYYEARQLTGDTCAKLFPDAYALQTARAQLLAERKAYLQRVEQEKKYRWQESLQATEDFSPTQPVPVKTKPDMADSSSTSTPIITPEDGDSGAWKYILLIIGICSLPTISRKIGKRRERRRAKHFFSSIRMKKGFLPIETELILSDEEQAFMETASTLNEIRSIRKYQRGNRGFRIAKGVYIGGKRGHSIGVPEVIPIDEGLLTVTNKQLVFEGQKNIQTIPLTKILSVNNTSNAIEISRQGRQKRMYFTVSDPIIWATVIKIMITAKDPMNLSDADLDIELK